MQTMPTSSPGNSKIGLGLILGVSMGLAGGPLLEGAGVRYPVSHLAGFALGLAAGLFVGWIMKRRESASTKDNSDESP